ncbi:hypothetical protein [Bacillus pseudomycoides]|uniref:hypothetical protein n=1 Tax=Bacillus pseudomycoides TaxID=64104 RepID=UPI002FFE9341
MRKNTLYPPDLHILMAVDEEINKIITKEKIDVISKIYCNYINLVSDSVFILCALRVLKMNCSIKLLQEDLICLLDRKI